MMCLFYEFKLKKKKYNNEKFQAYYNVLVNTNLRYIIYQVAFAILGPLILPLEVGRML